MTTSTRMMTTTTTTLFHLLFMAYSFSSVQGRSADRRMLGERPASILHDDGSTLQENHLRHRGKQNEVYPTRKLHYQMPLREEVEFLRQPAASSSAVSSINLRLLCSNGGSNRRDCMERPIPKQTLINLLFQIKTQMSDQPALNIPDKRKHGSGVSGFYSNW